MFGINADYFKRGNRKCPNCGRPVEQSRMLLKNYLWVKWRCRKCNSLLSFDAQRRLNAALWASPALLSLYLTSLISGWVGQMLFLFILIACYEISAWWWESVKLLEEGKKVKKMKR